MRIGTPVLVEQPDKVRFIGAVARLPRPITGQLGVVTESSGQDRIVPKGSRVSRLHVYDVAELRYVCILDGDGRVWEIVEVRWSHDNSPADLKEAKREFGLMDEEELTEHLREEAFEEASEGWHPKPDLTRTGREL